MSHSGIVWKLVKEVLHMKGSSVNFAIKTFGFEYFFT